MIRATVFGLIGTLAIAAAPAAAQVHVSARADLYVPAPGVFVVFSAPTLPDAVVVDVGAFGTVILEQRTRRGHLNTVRMNLRYPHRHRVRGHVVNDYVWINGRRTLASDAFGNYYEPRDRHHHRHTTVARHGGHTGYAACAHPSHRGRSVGHGHSGSRHDHARSGNRGHPGKAKGHDRRHKDDHKQAKKDRKERDKEARKDRKEREKQAKKDRKEREKQAKKDRKADDKQARKDRKADDKQAREDRKERDKDHDNGRRGNGNGRDKKNNDKKNDRSRKRV